MFGDDFFLMGSVLNPKFTILINEHKISQYDFERTTLKQSDQISLANTLQYEEVKEEPDLRH